MNESPAASAKSADSGTTWLTTTSGLSRQTVLKAIAQLAASGWDPTSDRDPGATVPVPAALLTNRKLRVHVRVLYGLLLLTPGFRHPFGQFTYAELAGLAQVSRNTVARGVDELAGAEWIRVERANRLARIHFELSFPGFAQGKVALARAQRRLDKAKHFGEALMREYLSLLIDSEDYEDDAAPGFLVNPRTDERLQLDRFYPPSVAFEFNGPQHCRATARFSEAEVVAQRERDYIKMGICVSRGITLIIILPEDLTLKGVTQKIGNLLPLRDLTGSDYGLLIGHLESESDDYREFVSGL